MFRFAQANAVGVSSSLAISTFCPGGELAVGGGYWFDSSLNLVLVVTADTPGGGLNTSWQVDVTNIDLSPHDVYTYVLCVGTAPV